MSNYDSKGKKIGRNSLCPCGSGKKYKHCHGRHHNRIALPTKKMDVGSIPKKVLVELEKSRGLQRQSFVDQRIFEARYGKSRPIISTEFKDWRVVAVGNELYFREKERTKYFPDFLTGYLRTKLGGDWGRSELEKPLEDRHQILKWYDCMCRYQQGVKQELNGSYCAAPNGAMLSWFRLAYDFYLVKHNAELQERILRRIRNKDQFQGARFELSVAATMIVAGFQVSFEDENDTSGKHVEFFAVHPSGQKVAVEAKSRHRDGILDYKMPPRHVGNRGQSAKVAVEKLIRKALTKATKCPYFIFIDTNLPYCDKNPDDVPWYEEMRKAVENVRQEWSGGEFPANAIFFCNDPTYQEQEEVSPEGFSFWSYVIPIENPKCPLSDAIDPLFVAKSAIQRADVPNEFPEQ